MNQWPIHQRAKEQSVIIIITASPILLFFIALGVSQRFRHLVIQHKLGLAVIACTLAGVTGLAWVVEFDYFPVDACLDSGGRWDKAREICLYEESAVLRDSLEK
jgi:hypothetical protein